MPSRWAAAKPSTPLALQEPGATLVGIYIASRAGAVMEEQSSAVLVPGVGIAGDRYALGTGHWSAPRWRDQELTLFEAETAARIGIEACLTRRNLVTQGATLSGLVGVKFRIGPALVVGVRACDPCRYIEQLNGVPGLTRALSGFDGGLRAHVVEGGRIGIGDAIEVVGLAE